MSDADNPRRVPRTHSFSSGTTNASGPHVGRLVTSSGSGNSVQNRIYQPQLNEPPLFLKLRQDFPDRSPLSLETGGNDLRARPSLVRPRNEATLSRAKSRNILAPRTEQDKTWYHPWWFFSNAVTCCIPDACIGGGKKSNKAVKQAWRGRVEVNLEKVALCFISAGLCAILGFITYGLQDTICKAPTTQFNSNTFANSSSPNLVQINGRVFDISSYLKIHAAIPGVLRTKGLSDSIKLSSGSNLTPFFPRTLSGQCNTLFGASSKQCIIPNQFQGITECHPPLTADPILAGLQRGLISYSWDQISKAKSLIVYKNSVISTDVFANNNQSFFGSEIDSLIRNNNGKDITGLLLVASGGEVAGTCLQAVFSQGSLEIISIGCFASQTILVIGLLIVASLIIVRFIFAIWFQWFISVALGRLEKNRPKRQARRREEIMSGRFAFTMNDQEGNLHKGNHDLPEKEILSEVGSIPVGLNRSETLLRRTGTLKSRSTYGSELYTIMLVTCYSESQEEIRSTFDSLALTDYNEDYKLLFVVADGIVTGANNSNTTPEIILSMLERDPNWPDPIAFPYVAVASGSRQLNYAKVYVAWYNHKGRSVPTILVVKTGNPGEINSPKPGNRGKRDSQIILMRFFEHVTFNERLSPLEYDLFQKIHYLMGVTPDKFEIVLMVDADTKVASDSLARMVACMVRDPLVMGLCGETRIANKSESYVSFWLIADNQNPSI